MSFTRKKSRKGNNNHLLTLVDRSVALSDGSIVSLQDSFESKEVSNRAPTSIPRNFERKNLWLKSTATFQVNVGTSGPTNGALYFTLSSINNYAQYAAIFDQYCISAAVVRLQTQYSVTPASTQFGTYVTCIDHDDASTITQAVALEYSTAVECDATQNQTRLIYPRFAVGAYSSSLNSYANTTGYIDCASTAVQHYGLKYSFNGASTNYAVSFYVDYFVHFRDFH
jgi:hypothetical protein